MLLTKGIPQDFILAVYSSLSATFCLGLPPSYSFMCISNLHYLPHKYSSQPHGVHVCSASYFGPFQAKIFPIHLICVIHFFHHATPLSSLWQSILCAFKFGSQHSSPTTVHPHLPFWIASGHHFESLLQPNSPIYHRMSSPCSSHHSQGTHSSASTYHNSALPAKPNSLPTS